MKYTQDELRDLGDYLANQLFRENPSFCEKLLEPFKRELNDTDYRYAMGLFRNGRWTIMVKTATMAKFYTNLRAELSFFGFEYPEDNSQFGPLARRLAWQLNNIISPSDKEQDMSCNCKQAADGSVSISMTLSPDNPVKAYEERREVYVTFGPLRDAPVSTLGNPAIAAALQAVEKQIESYRSVPEPRPGAIERQIAELVDARNKFVSLIDELRPAAKE